MKNTFSIIESLQKEWHIALSFPKDATTSKVSTEKNLQFRVYSDTKNAPYELVVMNKDIVEFLLRAEGSEYHHYPVLHSSGGVRIDPAGAPCELSPEITHIVQRAKEWIHGYAAKMKTGVWMMDELS